MQNLNHLPDGVYYVSTPNYSGLSQESKFRGFIEGGTNRKISMFPITEMLHEKPKQFKK